MYISPISTLNFLGVVKEYELPEVTEENSHNLTEYKELTDFTDTDLSISKNNEKSNFYRPSIARYKVSITKKLDDGATLVYSHSADVEKSLKGEKLESEIRPFVYNGYSLVLQDIINYKTGFPVRYSTVVKK